MKITENKKRRLQKTDIACAVLLLIGGVMNAFPGIFTPIVQSIAVGALNFQVILGVVSVVLALYLLLEKSR